MSRRSRRDEYRRTGRKPQKDEALNIDKDMLLKVGIGVVVLAVIAIAALIWHYNIPTVARVNNVRLNAEDVGRQMRGAEDILVWEYTARYPNELEIDYDRDFGGGRTFARAIREEAVKMAALTNLHIEYADELGLFLLGNESPAQIESIVVGEILARPDIFERFEPFMPVSDAEVGDARAQEILARALAGEDFDMLIETYGEDPGMVSNPDGYTFTSGVMVPEFEQATRELAIGEISGLVASNFGIHIIKRIEPIPGDDVMRPFGMSESQLMGEAVQRAFESRLDTASLEFAPALDRIPVEPATF